jgi:hypothetical protein
VEWEYLNTSVEDQKKVSYTIKDPSLVGFLPILAKNDLEDRFKQDGIVHNFFTGL